MKVLVVGKGGREHAIAWKLANDTSRPVVFCAPGNAGTAGVATNVAVGDDDIEGLVEWAKEEKPDLTVVGPEAPLCAGLADRFLAEGLPVFGPSSAAAKLEGSKTFAKEVMAAAGVPTATGQAFSCAQAAVDHIRKLNGPVVVKADGLAAGKGVFVCAGPDEAERAVRTAMIDMAFGEAGNEVLVEECLVGEEASILALVDGTEVVMLASSQDHKRALDGDAGLNTGGMGAYSPAPVVSDELWPAIRTRVFEPTLAELGRRGIEYQGVLYAGLMITDDGPKVLEFNCRFGDPETQAILPRLAGDLLPALQACVDGTLRPELVTWRDDPCVCVVMASGGYPGKYEKGKAIGGLAAAEALEGVTVFHAGTSADGDGVVTSGGRVLGVTALGADLRAAIDAAYVAVASISFDGARFRTDIGGRALDR